MNKSDMLDGDTFAHLAQKHNLFYATTHLLRDERQIDEIAAMPGPVNVLSHNSDGGILSPDDTASWFDFIWQDAPGNIGHWFAQNCDVRDPRLTPIPIGLETDRWHPPSQKKDALLATERFRIPPGLVYLNHTIRASHRTMRQIAYDLFSDKPWVTVKHMDQNFKDYYWQLSAHKFVFSPDGNGMDTCRTWEALYLGCYPIVERHVFTEEFAKGLPLLIVDDWSTITEEFLHAKYEEMSAKRWNWDMLTVKWWDRLIGKKLQ